MAIILGDSVRVLPGVKDQYTDIDLGGWQGRIVDIEQAGETYVEIAWGSITLRQMPADYIRAAPEGNFEYALMARVRRIIRNIKKNPGIYIYRHKNLYQ
jgi:hypothetical protein